MVEVTFNHEDDDDGNTKFPLAIYDTFTSNIATGETSQVITSRHFSSLLFTSMSILTSLALIN